MPIFREVLAMSAFVNVLALAVPVFTLQVYDRVIGHAGISTLIGFVIGMISIVIFDYILRQSRSRIMQTVALRIDVLVGRKLFDKLMALPLHQLESQPANYWQSLFRDVDTVRNTLSGGSALLLCDLPFAIMFLTLIWIIAAPIAWVLMIILPLFMFIAWQSSAKMSQANQEERQSTQTRDGLIAEIINGRTTVKALALDNAMRPMWEERHAENIENSVVRGARSDFYSNFGGSLTMITTVFMTTAGALAIIEGVLTMGALIATNMLTGRLIGPANQLVGQWRAYSSFLQSLDRLGEVFESTSEREFSEVKLTRPDGEIVTENVCYGYGENMPLVVDSVSITIKAHGVHALVGRNGSGKTTLLKILQGLYAPTNGRVLLDGADISQFSRSELASWLGYVPQECVLFAGTVRDNIIHRHPDASDEQIISAAKAAGVHQFIIDLPEGYASEIGEAGRRLSGGQRQRIAIARALLGDPPVILLDEPSASLDRQAEQALRTTLVEIGKLRTVIIITHSPILLAACDDLVALDRGKVALAGPSKEILPKLFGQQPKGDAQPAEKPAQMAKPVPAPEHGASVQNKPPVPRTSARPVAVASPPAASAQKTIARPLPPVPKPIPTPKVASKLTPKPNLQKAKPKLSKPAGPRPKPPMPATPTATPTPLPTNKVSAPAPKRQTRPKPPSPKRAVKPPAPQAKGSETIAAPIGADPSVPSGERFRTNEPKGSPFIDDPYADLIKSATEEKGSRHPGAGTKR